VDGSQVADVVFGDLNHNGQIAFLVSLADNRLAIFRADPVPEPSALLLPSLGIAFCIWRFRKVSSGVL
jgi:hypothetical protein